MMSIFLQAPIWVWPLLVTLLALGFLQSRDRNTPPLVVICVSVGFLCFSAYGTATTFSRTASGLWLAVLTITFIACRQWGYPAGWKFDARSKRLFIPGSWLPLILYLSIFAIKFSMGAMALSHPDLLGQNRIALPASALLGLLSGFFAARSWRAWCVSRDLSTLQRLPAQ